MKRTFLTSGLLAVLLATGLAACSREDTNSIAVPEPNSPTTSTPTETVPPDSTQAPVVDSTAPALPPTTSAETTPGATPGQTVDNAALTGKVKAALASDAGLKTLTLNVDSNDGVVTITGDVPSQQMSDTVNSVTRSVEGVRSVQNNLTVRP